MLVLSLTVFFCFPVFGAAQYPQETISETINGVGIYCTIDYRGFETSTYVGDFLPLKPRYTTTTTNTGSYTNETVYGKVHMFIETATVYHVSLTIRNRNDKIAVADLNNFQFKATGVTFNNALVGVCIRNSINADVYNVDYNDSNTNLYLSFRSVPSLTLQPDEQIDIQFDFCFIADYNNTGSLTDAPYLGTSAECISGNLGMTLNAKPSAFTLYTVEEYADTYESFWSYLIRALRSLSQHSEYDGTETNSAEVSSGSSDVTDTSDTIHASEAQWYQQNSTDIEATGLSNFQFSNNQITGLGGVRSDFNSLWSALSGWTLVYVFSLTLSLGILILRHLPRKITSNGHYGGGKSHASNN